MKRTCPICGKIVEGWHDHPRQQPKRQYRKYKSTPSRKIRNTKRWQNKRDEIKRRDNGVDQVAANGLDGVPYIESRNLQVHHIEPIEERPDLAFANDNLITVSPHTHELCERGLVPKQKLHDIAHLNNVRAGMEDRAEADYIEPSDNITVVDGSPGCGKSHYVTSHKGERDLVFDMDLICEALLGNDGGARKDHKPVIGIGVKIRDLVYKEIQEGSGGWERCWIITAERDPKLVNLLCLKLGARHKHIESTVDECIRNIQQDERTFDKEKRIELAKRWHDTRAMIDDDDAES